jgi:hypothetical protein
MKVAAIIFYFTLSVVVHSCSVNSDDINRYQTRFESHKQEFGILVKLLKEQNLRVGYSIRENELPENIRTLLQKLEISAVNLNTTECQDIVYYQFTSSWSSMATLYFSKDSCDKVQAVKGYHSKSSEMIEVWGLGDGWIMWIDYDFI